VCNVLIPDYVESRLQDINVVLPRTSNPSSFPSYSSTTNPNDIFNVDVPNEVTDRLSQLVV
jgi:hypothetical protein